MKKTLIVCSLVVTSIVGASMAVGAGQQAAPTQSRPTPTPVDSTAVIGMPAPQAPFDTTPITPMETVGAPGAE